MIRLKVNLQINRSLEISFINYLNILNIIHELSIILQIAIWRSAGLKKARANAKSENATIVRVIVLKDLMFTSIISFPSSIRLGYLSIDSSISSFFSYSFT